MRSQQTFAVACLSGDGIGPELMAEASRALAEAGRLHRFRVEELHAPFAGEAVSRHGTPLPAETRAACRRADAVLVALTKEPALEGVKAELDLTWRVQRVRLPDGDIAVVSPLDDQMEPFVVRRAFDLARSRKAKVAAVGDDPTWSTFVSWEADRHPGVEVERLSLSEALPRLMNAPDGFCVVVTPRAHAELVSDLAASRNDSRIVASGRLSQTGPGIFGPTHGSAPDIAGQGVANPSGMLLAASLMLSEGLGQHAAGRTLERAVSTALASGVRTADLEGRGGPAATTRDFMDAVLALMPSSRTDVEFFDAVVGTG